MQSGEQGTRLSARKPQDSEASMSEGELATLEQVLLVAANAGPLNPNPELIDHVAAGFGELLGPERVFVRPSIRAMETVAQMRTGFVLLFGSVLPDTCDFHALARAARKRKLPLVFWGTEDPYEFDAAYKVTGLADLIFSNDRWAAYHYELLGRHAEHLPLAASRSYYREILEDDDAYLYDVLFCGVGFDNRQRIIDGLRPILSRLDALICGSDWDETAPYVQNRRLGRDELLDAYQRSRLVLNLGRSHDYANDRFCITASTPGPRTFEVAMAGALQLFFADRPEVIDYYEPDREIVLFDGLKSATEAVERLLTHPEQRLAMARAAQERTLRDHQYVHRARTIVNRVLALDIG